MASSLLRWQQRWQAAGWWRLVLIVLLICVSWFAWTPNSPDLIGHSVWDKLNHAGAFAALTVAALFSVNRTRKNMTLVLFGLLCFGGLIELVQLLLVTRSAEWADLLADSVGMAVGCLLVASISQVARLKRKDPKV